MGANVSERKNNARTWTKTSKMEVDQKIQRQVVLVEMYAPQMGATHGPMKVNMP